MLLVKEAIYHDFSTVFLKKRHPSQERILLYQGKTLYEYHFPTHIENFSFADRVLSDPPGADCGPAPGIDRNNSGARTANPFASFVISSGEINLLMYAKSAP